jgi:hypothetical protein
MKSKKDISLRAVLLGIGLAAAIIAACPAKAPPRKVAGNGMAGERLTETTGALFGPLIQ